MKSIWIGVGVLLATSASAMAMGRGSNVCEPYAARFCGGLLQQSHEKLVQCLHEHWSDLSDDCKEVMTPNTPAQKSAQTDSKSSS